jgi:hypothetical protein
VALSGSNGSSTASTFTFGNLNGLSHYITNGSLVASYTVPTVPAQTVQPVAISGSNGSFAFSTVTFGSSNGLNFYTTNGSVVGSYTVPTVPAQTNQTVGFYASSQTTGQSSSSTFDARSMTFVGAGGVSIGASNGSIIFSGATGGGGGGGGIALANSQTTYTSGTVSLSAAGGAITIASNTGQRMDFSVPSVSSLYGASGILVTSNGGSISIANEHNSYWIPAQLANATISTLGLNTLYLMPLFPQDNYSFSGMQQIWSLSNNVNSTVQSYIMSHTISYALYEEITSAGSQLEFISSSSILLAASYSSNVAGRYTISQGTNSATYSSAGTGSATVFASQKVVDLPFNVSMEDGHVYYLAMAQSSAGSNAASTRALAVGMMMNAEITNASFGFLAPNTINAFSSSIGPQAMPCIYSATSGAFPGTISSNQTRVAASNASVYVFFKN